MANDGTRLNWKDNLRRQKHVLDELDQRRREDAAARERRLQREAKAHHQDDETLDDLRRVYRSRW